MLVESIVKNILYKKNMYVNMYFIQNSWVRLLQYSCSPVELNKTDKNGIQITGKITAL